MRLVVRYWNGRLKFLRVDMSRSIHSIVLQYCAKEAVPNKQFDPFSLDPLRFLQEPGAIALKSAFDPPLLYIAQRHVFSFCDSGAGATFTLTERTVYSLPFLRAVRRK